MKYHIYPHILGNFLLHVMMVAKSICLLKKENKISASYFKQLKKKTHLNLLKLY